MTLPSSLSTADLAQRCAEETDKYYRRDDADPQLCFELLRRALREQQAEAFTHVAQIFERFVMSAVRQHPRFALTNESAEFFANAALRSFYFALRGPKFDRIRDLPAALSYLRACVSTAIAMYLRGPVRVHTIALEDVPEPSNEEDLEERLEADELWSRVLRLLPDDRDQLLARLTFVLGYKPRDICSLHPTYWTTEREVSVALYRIRSVLRAHLRKQEGSSDAAAPAEG